MTLDERLAEETYLNIGFGQDLIHILKLYHVGVKEKLYKNRFNYYETIDENVYQRAAQNTAQMANSDLLEENNMMTLFAIKRILERDCWDRLYDFTSSKARADFTDYEMAKFQSWQGRQLDTIDIRFDANEWEGERWSDSWGKPSCIQR